MVGCQGVIPLWNGFGVVDGVPGIDPVLVDTVNKRFGTSVCSVSSIDQWFPTTGT